MNWFESIPIKITFKGDTQESFTQYIRNMCIEPTIYIFIKTFFSLLKINTHTTV